ncbi:MAG: hypothetical protein AAGJ46_03615 [Planctomycetota bacterium]
MTPLSAALRKIADRPTPERAVDVELSANDTLPPSVSEAEVAAEVNRRVYLYCAAPCDSQIAQQAARQECDAVFTLVPSAISAGSLASPSVYAEPNARAADSGGSPIEPTSLPLVDGEVQPRHWVRFLDQCRQGQPVTGLVSATRSRAWLAWLASRCDGAFVVASPSRLGPETRRLAWRLRQVRSDATCLTVEAA